MASITYNRIPVPRSEQNQIVDYTARQVDAQAFSHYIQPGYYRKIPHSYRLLNYSIYLIASAVVANRTITVLIRRYDIASGTHHQVFQAITGNIAANEDGLLIISPLGALSGLTNVGATVVATAQLNPEGIYLSGNDYIGVGIGSVQAGDRVNIGAQFEYQNLIRGIKQP